VVVEVFQVCFQKVGLEYFSQGWGIGWGWNFLMATCGKFFSMFYQYLLLQVVVEGC
jgi:hypothetical protein